MSTSKGIVYTSEANPDQKASVSYTYNDDFSEVTITDFTIEGISDVEYPKFTSDIEFKAAFVNSDGILVSAAGFVGDVAVFTPVTGELDGEKNLFGYLSTGKTIETIEPCTVEVT